MTTDLSFVYRVIITAVAIYLVFRYRTVDKPSRIICWLVWLGLLTEAAGYYSAVVYRTNYFVFNISFFAEFALMSFYFIYSNKSLAKRNSGVYVTLAALVLGGLNSCLFQSPRDTLNSHFLFLECIVVMCFALLSLFRLLLADDDKLQLHRMVHFWLPCILLFYQCATMAAWGVYELPGQDDEAAILDKLILTINIMTYAGYGIVFLLYPKMKLPYVSTG